MKNIQRFLVINFGLLIIVVILSLSGNRIFGDLLPTQTQPVAIYTVTNTPTKQTYFGAVTKQPSFCHNGPSENYQIATELAAFTIVNPFAVNKDGDWFFINDDKETRCWVKINILSFDFDPSLLIRLSTPEILSSTLCYTNIIDYLTIQTVIPAGWSVAAYGKSNLEADWVLVVPHDSTIQCWVASSSLGNFDPSLVPVVSTLPEQLLVLELTFTATTTPSATSTTSSTNINTIIPGIPTYTKTPNPQPSSTSQPPPPTSILTSTSTAPPLPTQPPSTSTPQSTATLCWPPGRCK